MKAYLSSASGRLLALSAAFGFAGAALVPLLGLPLQTLALVFVGVTGLLVATVFSAIDSHPTAAVVLSITLPQSLFAYVYLSIVAASRAPHLGWLLLVLSYLALADLVAFTAIIPVIRHRPRHA